MNFKFLSVVIGLVLFFSSNRALVAMPYIVSIISVTTNATGTRSTNYGVPKIKHSHKVVVRDPSWSNKIKNTVCKTERWLKGWYDFAEENPGYGALLALLIIGVMFVVVNSVYLFTSWLRRRIGNNPDDSS
jgi:uncharacterized membrane protein YraQ (UPF0718 family)